MNKAVGRHPGAHCPATRAELWLSGPCRHSMMILAFIGLSGCSQEPVVRIQYIQTHIYVPIPATLTQPISVDLTEDTWGKAVGDLKAGLEACNGNLSAVAGLKPPS